MNNFKVLSHVGLGIALVAGLSFGIMSQGTKIAQAFYDQSDKRVPITPVTPITNSSRNLAPKVISESIPVAQPNSTYYARIVSIDKNVNDTLTAEFGTLPGNIKVSWCNQSIHDSIVYFTCEIAGEAPTTPGTYEFKYEVSDNHGATDGKVFTLVVPAQSKK